MTIHERKLMVFRLLDCENNGQISGEGMVCCRTIVYDFIILINKFLLIMQEILLYRVSIACSRILGKPTWKSSKMKHLKNMIFRDFGKSRNDDASLSLDEYLQWSDEVLRGGESSVKESTVSSSEVQSVEDIYEFFSNFLDIFDSASTSVAATLSDLKSTFRSEIEALDLNNDSPFEDVEHGNFLEGEFECAVKAAKVEAQRIAGEQIEAMVRRRKQVYQRRTACEKACRLREAAVEEVQRNAMAIASSTSHLTSLENYHTMMIEEIVYTKNKYDETKKRFHQVKEIDENMTDALSQLKMRRSLLSEKLNVFSGELQSVNKTIHALHCEKKTVLNASNGEKMNHSIEIRLNRLEAKLEVVNADKRRLKKLLDECALESGQLMTDQLSLENKQSMLKAKCEKLKLQVSTVKACYDYLISKEARVNSMLQQESNMDKEECPETEEEKDIPGIYPVQLADVAENLVTSVKIQAGQYITLIDLACFKIEELQSARRARIVSKQVEEKVEELRAEKHRVESRLRQYQRQSDVVHEHANATRLEAEKEIAFLASRKGSILADIEHAKLEEKIAISRAEEVSRQAQIKVDNLRSNLEQKSRSLISQHFVANLLVSRSIGGASMTENSKNNRQSSDDMAGLEDCRRSILADIESARSKVSELNVIIAESQFKAKLVTDNADEQVKASQAVLNEVKEEVARLKVIQSKVQDDVAEAESRAAQIRQEAEEIKLRAAKVAANSRSEIEQLRRDQEAAEAQVEAVVEMTENMILEAEQEKTRLTNEREAALESANEARQKVLTLEAEVLSLRSSNDESTRREKYNDLNGSYSNRSMWPKTPKNNLDDNSFKLVWEKCADNEGDTFYFNRVTEESSWTKPPENDIIGGSGSMHSDMVSLEGMHFRKLDDGEGKDYWMNDDTGSIIEESRLELAKKSISDSMKIANSKQKELDELSEVTRLNLETKAADEAAARQKATDLTEGIEAARVKAEQSVLEANAQVEWAQLLVVQSNDEIALLNLEQSSLVKDVEVAESSIHDIAETTVKSGLDRVVGNTCKIDTLPSDCDNETMGTKIDSQTNTLKIESVKAPSGRRAKSRKRISYDWEECHDDEDDVFYYNKRTEESSWTKPEIYETATSRFRNEITGSDDADSIRTRVESHNGKNITRIDQGDGMSYWMNESTGSVCDDISSISRNIMQGS